MSIVAAADSKHDDAKKHESVKDGRSSEKAGRGFWWGREKLPVLEARLIVGFLFVQLGWNKIQDLPHFHKVVREYDMLPLEPAWLLNGTAIYLPGLEIVLGVAILCGLFRRTAFFLALALLLAFTPAVALRGVELQTEHNQAVAAGTEKGDPLTFCEIAFDCGCGTGEVNVCSKVGANTGLALLCLIGLLSGSQRLTLDRLLFRSRGKSASS